MLACNCYNKSQNTQLGYGHFWLPPQLQPHNCDSPQKIKYPTCWNDFLPKTRAFQPCHPKIRGWDVIFFPLLKKHSSSNEFRIVPELSKNCRYLLCMSDPISKYIPLSDNPSNARLSKLSPSTSASQPACQIWVTQAVLYPTSTRGTYPQYSLVT